MSDKAKIYNSLIGEMEMATAKKEHDTAVTVVLDREGKTEWSPEFRAGIAKIFQEENEKYALIPVQTEKPIVAPGRVSLYEGLRGFLPNERSPVPTNFNFQVLDLIKNLSIWNPHFSMAVENIMTLGNTDYEIKFGNKVGDAQATKYREYLWSRVNTWYEFADGEETLDNDLLTQVCNYGAISAEAVIRGDMRGIQNVVRVDPVYVRFAYDREKAIHVALQETGGIDRSILSNKYPGYIELNPNTYFYIALQRMGEAPYAVPPLASALDAVFTENDMIMNFKNMMKKLGMMGFLSVLVNAPMRLTNERDEAYFSRLSGYLETLRPQVEKGFSNGVVLGFKDTHEFEVHAPMNPAAADQAMNMVQSLVYAGLKQDPNMHGKNYSVTETFGRVLLEKMTLQVANKQKLLGSFKARLFKLELLLNGVRVDDLTCEYEKAATADTKRDEEIGGLKRLNLQSDFDAGLISQDARARALGYDEAFQKEPRESDVIKVAREKTAATAKANKTKASNSKKLDAIKKKLKASPVFNYFVPEECFKGTELAKFPQPQMQRYVNKYFKAVDDQFSMALDRAQADILSQFNGLRHDSKLKQVQAAVVFGLYQNWDNNFMNPVETIADENITVIYDHYRKDKTIFDGAESLSKTKQEFLVVPEAVFDLIDYRAIAFFEELDHIYLGRFITDPDTEKRIMVWLREQFEKGDVPLGKGSELVQSFIREFVDVVQMEAWKIRRIVETSANRVRNFSNVRYMQQSLIIEYEVVEAMDDLTCAWCQHMNRKKFSVRETVEKYERLFRRGANKMRDENPFATSIKIDEFVKLDPKQIQAKGVDLPSYHPHCRGRVIAHFKT